MMRESSCAIFRFGLLMISGNRNVGNHAVEPIASPKPFNPIPRRILRC